MSLRTLCLFYVLITVTLEKSYNVTNKSVKQKVKTQKLKFEKKLLNVGDDMLVDENQYNQLFKKSTSRRNGLLVEKYHWPSGIVSYKFGSNFSLQQKEIILNAMKKISERSCIQFMVAPENSTKYVNIIKPEVPTCSTAVGYQGIVQPMKLATACMFSGVVQHELMHTLGFFHEQSDPERDKYILVNYKNVKSEKMKNFLKFSSKSVGSLSTGYDYNSIMHYGPLVFTKNGEPTIVPLKEGVVIGQRDKLSDKDLLKLNLLYKCPNKSENIETKEETKSNTIPS